MQKISVLGSGMVGSVMAIDLSSRFDISVYDINEKSFEKLQSHSNIKTFATDLSQEKNIQNAITNADFVVNAVPGFMGFQTLKTIIESNKNVVDISFFPEDPFELDELAKKHNVVAIMDFGVAPGMSNIICGFHNKRMEVTDYKCFVGGLPERRVWPLQYKAPFSPIDVVEEYVRPARYVVNGSEVVKPALSDVEHIDFEKIGTLEAFNSDGLRSLIKTMPNIPNMIEKTLRYPGTVKYMEVLREIGFFSQEKVEINGISIKPIDLTAKLLFPKWKLDNGEKEFTVMRVIVEGTENDLAKTYTYDLLDYYNAETDASSMSRTTGYTCTAAVNLLVNGLYNRIGISPPEFLGEDETVFRYILNYLKERKVIYKISES